MRILLKVVAGIVVLYVVATGAYYLNRKKAAQRENRSYKISRAPVDLFRELTGGEPSKVEPLPPPQPGEEPEPLPEVDEPEKAAPPEVPERAPVRVDPEEILSRARDHYQAGRFDAALAEMDEYARSSDPRFTDLADRSRLFAYLIEDTPEAAEIDPGPMALIQLRSGDPFLVRVVDETDAEITFRKPGGIGARVKKKDLKVLEVGRTPDQKKALAEKLYQRRHAELADAADYLSLARFCRAHALGDHVPYLLERGLEAQGDALERALYEVYEAAVRAGATGRASTARHLLDRFFEGGEVAVVAHQASPAKPRMPAVAAVGPEDDEPDGAPPSGIGSVEEKGRKSPVLDADVNALLAEADQQRRKGDEHYELSFPGCPDRAEHRKTALAAYNEAYRLYELLQERWGVKLERTIKQVQTRRYELIKDTPAR